MIEYIRGELTEATPATAVIETAGVGYLLHISLSTYSSLSIGQQTKLFVFESIREDAHLLFGFQSKEEREAFLLLISVSGVGANTARVILSSLSVYELQNAISGGNVGLLKSVKGIGAKTAERIIVDLKDKFKLSIGMISSSQSAFSHIEGEALEALTILGFTKNAAQKVVAKIVKDHSELKVEEVIKVALKML